MSSVTVALSSLPPTLEQLSLIQLFHPVTLDWKQSLLPLIDSEPQLWKLHLEARVGSQFVELLPKYKRLEVLSLSSIQRDCSFNSLLAL